MKERRVFMGIAFAYVLMPKEYAARHFSLIPPTGRT